MQSPRRNFSTKSQSLMSSENKKGIEKIVDLMANTPETKELVGEDARRPHN